MEVEQSQHMALCLKLPSREDKDSHRVCAQSYCLPYQLLCLGVDHPCSTTRLRSQPRTAAQVQSLQASRSAEYVVVIAEQMNQHVNGNVTLDLREESGDSDLMNDRSKVSVNCNTVSL